MKYWLLLGAMVAGLWAAAQKINPVAVKSAAFYNKAIVQIKPVYKNYITQTSKALSNRRLNADSLKSTMKVPNNTMFSNLSNMDVETLTLLVMQATATDNEADIRNIMADMEKNRQQKDALRKEEDNMKAAQSKLKDSLKNKMAKENARLVSRSSAIKKEKDSLDDMNQQQQLKLQQMMDKKSQLEQMISNMMKAQGDTQNELSKNLKAS